MTANILVTGGNGFIGSHLVRQLMAAGHQVTVLSRSAVGYGNGRLAMLTADFADVAAYADLLPRFDAIYHLAVTTNPGNSNDRILFDARTNLMGSLALIEAAARAKVSRFVFVSSGGSVYGPNGGAPIAEDHPTAPISAHGVMKLTIEKYLHVFWQQYGMPYRVARVANPYGEGQHPDRGQGLIAYVLGRLARQEEIVVWGDGSVVRDYLYVGDVVDALLRMRVDNGRYQTYNVGSGEGLSVNEVIAALEARLGLTAIVRYVAGRPADVPYSCLDVRRIDQELGWTPQTTLADGISRTWRWIQHSYLPQVLTKAAHAA
ncbi:MAG: NAD-dependent epimerase/dehydratase family protein [Anaerolineales bacterium]|nr:NAD-dependent epimerase/dehydratase family protein [Anaerolineales bacterium]